MAVAFLFPGQGSQKVGMGAALLEERPDLIEPRLQRAQETSGLPIAQLCAEGPEELLTRTDAAQPALFAVALAVDALARESGLRPDLVAGHSLGEYTAAVASGALAEEDGAALVAERGRLMAAAQDERPGAMAAILGLDLAKIVELCDEASVVGVVVPANINTPKQVVVSGEQAAVDRICETAAAAGADRVVPLKVGAAFHSPLMEDTRERMRELAAGMTWRDPSVPLVSNASGKAVTTGDDVRDALITQIAAPVRWTDVVAELAAHDVDVHIELGPGRTLIGLVRQTREDAECFAADSSSKLVKAIERVGQS